MNTIMEYTENDSKAAGAPSALNVGLYAGFTVAPQLTDLDYGPEPSLYTIVCKFYEDRGLTPESARKTAVAYSREWYRMAHNAI